MSTVRDHRDLEVKSRRPSDSAFKQQRLPAWQPILTAGTVLPSFFIIGIVFVPVGVVLLLISRHLLEINFDYTDCMNDDGIKCSEADKYGLKNCTCNASFELMDAWRGEIYLFYGLHNFYQNHRRYVKSRDDNQLRGYLKNEPSSDCQPFAYSDDKKPILPCGAIANSLFNDTFTFYYEGEKVPLLRTGIAWVTDREIKFKNPPGDLKEGGLKLLPAVYMSHYPLLYPQALEANYKKRAVQMNKRLLTFQGFAKPKNWQKNLWELDPENPSNNGLQNEDLIVWMRTAALPSFRKLYRRVDHSQEPFKMGLPRGNYTIVIEYFYQVKSFRGKKRVILTSTSILGCRNPFLGIAYIVVGLICFFLGVAFLVIHLKYGKSTSEIITISQRVSD